MNNTPMISVIVPVYNVEKYLKKCIDSILNQTFSDLEIILVDDGSSDESGYICDAYAKEDCRVKVIHKKNGGLSDARNVGIEHSCGEWIGFVDSDDHIAADMYEFLYNIAIRENCDVAMCEFFHCYQGRDISYNKEEYYEVVNNIEAIHCVLESKITSVTVVNKLYHKTLFNDIRFRPGKTAEDAFIIVDLLEQAHRVVITNIQKYYYYHRMDSITTKPMNDSVYDVVEAYEYNSKRAMEISPELESVTLLRQCWARFYVLDKMMLSDGSYDKKKEKEYIAFLKENTKFILETKIFTIGRKIGLICLHISKKLYKLLVHYNEKKNKAAHE